MAVNGNSNVFTKQLAFPFDEVKALVDKLTTPTLIHDPTLIYVCALMCELAYYHIGQFEVDSYKRAMIVPCKAYRLIIRSRSTPNVRAYLRRALRVDDAISEEDVPFFVIVDRRIIAVGILINQKLFIGFRGTAFLFDWRINLRAPLIPINFYLSDRLATGRFHRGFAEEAVRISAKIMEQIKRKWAHPDFSNFYRKVTEIILCGHSLGGAVAAISKNLLNVGCEQKVIVIGAPRYCDTAVYYSSLQTSDLPIQIRRSDDIIPCIPPGLIGYADHPLEYDTGGKPFYGNMKGNSNDYVVWRAACSLRGTVSHI